MEPEMEGAKRTKEGEEDNNSRASSISSASAESAVSDFSFDENGSSAQEPDQPEKGLSQEEEPGPDPDPEGSGGASLESPPTQVMERPAESSGYRIPSYVFARNKSNTPTGDWSTASNESLFSIHTGNMSFTREQFSWLMKSGELGAAAAQAELKKSRELPPLSPKSLHKSGEMMPQPGPVPDVGKSGEQIIAAHFHPPSTSPSPNPNPNLNPSLSSSPNPSPSPSPSPATTPVTPLVMNKVASSPRFSEASAVDLATSAPVKKEDVKKGGAKGSVDDIPFSASTVSHHSDASGQSFAFPVLTDIDRQKSVNSGASRVEQSKDQSTAKEKEDKSKAPKSTAESTPSSSSSSSSWFSCFSCCSCWTSKS